MRFNRTLLDQVLKRGDPIAVAVDRQTGRSTAQALRFLAFAIDNPGTQVQVRDHHGTLQADSELTMVCRSIVKDLRLTGFTFTKTTLVCRFSEVI